MESPDIIITLGPASEQSISDIVAAGASIIRLNFSHGTQQWHTDQVYAIRKQAPEAKILFDTRGPEIRTGVFQAPVSLETGDRLTLINKEMAQKPENKLIFCTYLDLPKTSTVDDIILFDNGNFSGKVTSVHQNSVVVEILSDGILGSRRHINLPGERVSLPTIGKHDEQTLALAKELQVDMVALSFVRDSKDIRQAKKLAGKEVKIIAKIENQEGVDNFRNIARESDGIMIARGDLGVELPIEHIPVLQRKMLRDLADFPETYSIVATGLLRSMVTEKRPHRSEVTDIATAVWEGADALMLSDETAVGKYPIETVTTMKTTIDYALEHFPKKKQRL